MSIDFSAIHAAALPNAVKLIESWLPNGYWEGPEYVCRNPTRPDAHSGSFKVNRESGRWGDFATTDRGGDLISLFAFVNGINQGEAARRVADELGIATNGRSGNAASPPDHTYKLYDASGELIATKYRLDARNGREKQLWVTPRGVSSRTLPLFRSEFAKLWPAESTVVVAEGESAAERLAQMGIQALGTACGAAVTPNDTALRVLLPFEVILWPDRDKAGLAHMERIGERLLALGAQSLGIIDPAHIPGLKAKGDAADLDDDAVRDALACAWRQFERRRAVSENHPAITVAGGELPQAADAAQAWLSKEHRAAGVYDRGGFLVRITRNESLPDEEARLRRPIGAPTLRQCSATMLIDTLTRGIGFQRTDRRSDKLVPIDCPLPIAETVISRAGDGRLKGLLGVIEAPVMRADGSILTRSGYDEATGLILSGDERWLSVSDRPSAREITEAIDTLKKPLAQFPFVGPGDLAVVISAILTAIQRRLMASAPAHAFDANVQAAGKSLLAALVALIATGRAPVCVSLGKDETELSKLLVSILLAGDLIVTIDNISRSIRSDALASIITEPFYSPRLLGALQRLNLPTNVLWLMTGNNLRFSGDMPSRILSCRIVPDEEDPATRSFEIPDLRSYVRDHRGELVAAALTVLRGHFVAGRPDMGLRTWARFDQWSRDIRAALVWAGFADPYETRARLVDDDPERSATQALLEAWYHKFADQPVQSSELLKDLLEGSPLFTAVSAVARSEKGAISPLRLGQWCAAHADQTVGGYRLKKGSKEHGFNRWYVVETKETSGTMTGASR